VSIDVCTLQQSRNCCPRRPSNTGHPLKPLPSHSRAHAPLPSLSLPFVPCRLESRGAIRHPDGGRALSLPPAEEGWGGGTAAHRNERRFAGKTPPRPPDCNIFSRRRCRLTRTSFTVANAEWARADAASEQAAWHGTLVAPSTSNRISASDTVSPPAMIRRAALQV
jgi:hypothetical protein